MPPHLLLIQSDVVGSASVLNSLRRWYAGKFTVELIRRCSDAVSRLSEGSKPGLFGPVVAAIVDLELQDSTGVTTFDRIYAAAAGIPILVLCSHKDELGGRVTVRRGAQDYLRSDRIDPYSLTKALSGAIERAAASRAALQSGFHALITLASIGDGVITTDERCRITYLNAIAENLTGWDRSQAEGRRLNELIRTAETPVDVMPNTEARGSLNGTHGLRHCNVLVRRDGTTLAIDDSTRPIHDPAGRVTGTVVVFRDATATRQQIDRLAYLAEHDQLTGLCKRRLLRDRINHSLLLAERSGHKLAVLFIDIDHFKEINHRHGHSGGDIVLRSIATQLKNCTRQSDIVSREGGDEFVVVLSQVIKPIDAVCSAEKILIEISKPAEILGEKVCVTASIGIATWPENGTDAEALLGSADGAMYRAKELGRNGYQFAPVPDESPTIRLCSVRL